MLSLAEYIISRGYQFDSYTMEKFQAFVDNDKLEYVNDELLAWMGFTSVEYHNKLTPFKAHLKLNLKDVDHFTIPVNEYNAMLDAAKLTEVSLCTKSGYAYPSIDLSKSTATVHIFIAPSLVKSIVLDMKTDCAKSRKKEIDICMHMLFDYLKYTQKHMQTTFNDQLKTRDDALEQKDNEIKQRDLQLALHQVHPEHAVLRVININPRTPKQYVYLMTSINLAATDRYKLGKTVNMNMQVPPYNTIRPELPDKLHYCWRYLCYDSSDLKHQLKKALTDVHVRDTTDVFELKYGAILHIINPICIEYTARMSNITAVMTTIQTDNNAYTEQAMPLLTHNAEPTPLAIMPAMQFTYTISSKTTTQTYELILELLNGYKLMLAGKRGSWDSISKWLMVRIKQRNINKPNLKQGKEQIMHLAVSIGITMK